MCVCVCVVWLQLKYILCMYLLGHLTFIRRSPNPVRVRSCPLSIKFHGEPTRRTGCHYTTY